MCCSFHEEAGGEILNDYYLKYLTSGHPSLRSLTFVHARRDRFSSSEPLNVHFSIGIGCSHVKERNFLPLCAAHPACWPHARGISYSTRAHARGVAAGRAGATNESTEAGTNAAPRQTRSATARVIVAPVVA